MASRNKTGWGPWDPRNDMMVCSWIFFCLIAKDTRNQEMPRMQ